MEKAKIVMVKTEEVQKDELDIYLEEVVKISDSILDLERKMFTLALRNGRLVANVTRNIANDLFCRDLLASSEAQEIDLLNFLMHNECKGDSYNIASALAQQLDYDSYEPDSTLENIRLLMYITLVRFKSEFENIEHIDQVTSPMPVQFYMQILAKSEKEAIYIDENGVEIAGVITNARFEKSMFGINTRIWMEVVSKSDDEYVIGSQHFLVQNCMMPSCIEDFGLRSVTAADKDRLAQRGKKYVIRTKNPEYCMYNGVGTVYGYRKDKKIAINGRIMIDPAGMKAIDPDIDNDWYFGSMFSNSNDIGYNVSEDLLWKCSPYVYGFSFANKEWCSMEIEKVSDIKFAENAFDELIIKQEYKDIFMSSITNDMPSFDSIEGKGGGKIFLLDGTPGCGR